MPIEIKRFRLLYTILYFAIASVLVGSCKCGDPYGPSSAGVSIGYKNSKGQEMFDRTTPNYFQKDSIIVKHLNSSPPGFEEELTVHKGNSNSYYIGFSFYLNQVGVEKKYIIKLNKITYDTLTLAGDAVLRKVVYNGKTIPPPSGSNDYPQEFYFTVTK